MFFFHLTPHSLEEEVVVGMLEQHPEVGHENLAFELSYFDDKSLRCKIQRILEDYGIVYLIGDIPTNSFADLADQMTRLEGNANICLLVQVAAILRHRLDHFETLVAAYASSGTMGALVAGATDCEADYLVLRDYLAHDYDITDALALMANQSLPFDDPEDFNPFSV